jgi:hypothetical protein
MNGISYRKLRKYKYQLLEEFTIQTNIKDQDINLKFLSLSPDGLLTIHKGYAWDGPSGPTIDTKDFMRGSLIHDALYQLMRLSALDYEVHRKRADEILKEICLVDGMCALRAWYVYQGVRLFAETNARPRQEPEVQILSAP